MCKRCKKFVQNILEVNLPAQKKSVTNTTFVQIYTKAQKKTSIFQWTFFLHKVTVRILPLMVECFGEVFVPPTLLKWLCWLFCPKLLWQ